MAKVNKRNNDVVKTIEVMRSVGFTKPTLIQLALTYEFGDTGFTIAEVSESFNVSPSKLNYSVGALIQKGLLDADNGEVFLSDKGKQMHADLPKWARMSYRLFTLIKVKSTPLSYMAILVEIARSKTATYKSIAENTSMKYNRCYVSIETLSKLKYVEIYSTTKGDTFRLTRAGKSIFTLLSSF